MLPVTVESYISAPREAVYDYVADLAGRVAFMDHYLHDFRLAHPKSDGVGAGARYLVKAPLNKQYYETQIVEAERPRRIVEAVHGGRGGRSRGGVEWEFERQGQGLTRVRMTTWNEPGTIRDRLKERFGTRGWRRRQAKSALERLRAIFEERPAGPLARVSVAGLEPMKAPRFGASSPVYRG